MRLSMGTDDDFLLDRWDYHFGLSELGEYFIWKTISRL